MSNISSLDFRISMLKHIVFPLTPFDDKYSAPSTGDPKVFVKYFCVNTVTCEKSGEMLGVASYTESE